MRAPRLLLCLALLACLPPESARADWLITPFIGLTRGGETTYVVELGGLATKFTFGGSLAHLGDGLLGFEVDLGYSSRFFDRGDMVPIIERSSLTTLTGNVIVAVPRAVTGESLRPYVIGGLGLMHPDIDYVRDVFEVNSNLLALDLGGGAIGALTERTSLRFDLRYFKSLTEDTEAVAFGTTRLSFWRAAIGVALRY